MIVRSRPMAREVLFSMRGSIMPRILRPLLFVLLVSLGAVLLSYAWPRGLSKLAAIPFTLIGLSLSIFMSFRNTVCYARWWEGRNLWGRFVITARSVARQTADLAPADRNSLLAPLCAFGPGLAARLRGEDEPGAIAGGFALAHAADAADDWRSMPNPTDSTLALAGLRVRRLTRAGVIEAQHAALLEQQFVELGHVQGGCERIRNTPVPFAYALLLHRTAYAFCILLPFALAPSLGFWALLPSLLVAYAFFGLDALGDQLSDPFGREDNDLPLDAMVVGVQRELLHAMGCTDLPPAKQPIGLVRL